MIIIPDLVSMLSTDWAFALILVINAAFPYFDTRVVCIEFGIILLRFVTLFIFGLEVPAFVDGLVSKNSLMNCIYVAKFDVYW